MHVGGICVFQGHVAREAVVQRVRERVHLIPRYAMRLDEAPLGLANMLNCGGAVRDFHWQTSPENGRPAAPQLSVEVRG